MVIPCLTLGKTIVLLIIISMIAGWVGTTFGFSSYATNIAGAINLGIVIIWAYGFFRDDCVYDRYGNYNSVSLNSDK
jgi:hypothetical protein